MDAPEYRELGSSCRREAMVTSRGVCPLVFRAVILFERWPRAEGFLDSRLRHGSWQCWGPWTMGVFRHHFVTIAASSCSFTAIPHVDTDLPKTGRDYLNCWRGTERVSGAPPGRHPTQGRPASKQNPRSSHHQPCRQRARAAPLGRIYGAPSARPRLERQPGTYSTSYRIRNRRSPVEGDSTSRSLL